MRLGDFDALKETIINFCGKCSNNITEYDENNIPNGNCAIWHILNMIDNAPTVEISQEQTIDKLNEIGWLYNHDKAIAEFERPQDEIKKYKPLEPDYNVQCAVENLKTAYWSNDSEKFAKVFTDAEEIIVSAICHHGYSVCKQSQDNITEEDIQNAIKAGYENGYSMAQAKYQRPQGIEREIVGYEGLYSVDIFGTVRNLLSGKIIEHYVNEYGYHNVYLYKDGEKKGKRVNRLVAMAFIPNPLGKPQVNHIDGNKDDNNVWNLEWVTNKENSVHAGKTGLYGNGQVKIVETGEVFPNVSSLARYLNVDRSNIYKCLQGKRNKVRGYHFEKIGADMRKGGES